MLICKAIVSLNSVFLKTVDQSSKILGTVTGWLILPLIFATVYEVFSRYFFNSPTIWAYEIATMATGTVLLLGAPYTLKEKAHIRIDVFYSGFSQRKKLFIDIFGYTVFILPVGFWLSHRLGLYALEAFETGEQSGESTWNPVIWPYRVVFCLGILLLTLQAAAEWLRAIMQLFCGKKDE